MADLLVIGSGSLARSICYSMAACCTSSAQIAVLARSGDRVSEACYISNARAALSRRPVRFTPLCGDITSDNTIAGIIAAQRPQIIISCASLQSPWEGTRSPSQWTAFLHDAGFGVTLPLQSFISVKIAAAIKQHSAASLFVNGCYPDAVNPLLRSLDLPVLGGIGNTALVAASLQTALGLPDQADLRVLAHHLHLQAPADQRREVRAWQGGRPLTNVGVLLGAQRGANRQELNAVTGHVSALVVDSLLTGSETYTHLPGPQGLPGGYPVRIADHRVELLLPPGITLDDAVAWNQQMAEYDGVVVTAGGVVRFGAAARAELARYLPGLAEGFHATQLGEACSGLLELRCVLRGGPAPGAGRVA